MSSSFSRWQRKHACVGILIGCSVCVFVALMFWLSYHCIEEDRPHTRTPDSSAHKVQKITVDAIYGQRVWVFEFEGRRYMVTSAGGILELRSKQTGGLHGGLSGRSSTGFEVSALRRSTGAGD